MRVLIWFVRHVLLAFSGTHIRIYVLSDPPFRVFWVSLPLSPPALMAPLATDYLLLQCPPRQIVAPPLSCSRLAPVNERINGMVWYGMPPQPDDLWKAKCAEDWGEKRKVCPHQRSPLVLVRTYLQAWRAWRRAFNGYHGEDVRMENTASCFPKLGGSTAASLWMCL